MPRLFNVADVLILRSIIAQTMRKLLERDLDRPVQRSADLDGSDEVSKPFVRQDRGRIKVW